MNSHSDDQNRFEPDRYEIRLKGRLDERWSSWFDGTTLEIEPGGVTVLRGSMADQAALHGLLASLRDLGLPLISVTTTTGAAEDAGQDAGPATR